MADLVPVRGHALARRLDWIALHMPYVACPLLVAALAMLLVAGRMTHG